jgi:hypothetical protein
MLSLLSPIGALTLGGASVVAFIAVVLGGVLIVVAFVAFSLCGFAFFYFNMMRRAPGISLSSFSIAASLLSRAPESVAIASVSQGIGSIELGAIIMSG